MFTLVPVFPIFGAQIRQKAVHNAGAMREEEGTSRAQRVKEEQLLLSSDLSVIAKMNL